jgi:RNA polymerase sigma factor (TIGR02999 family)
MNPPTHPTPPTPPTLNQDPRHDLTILLSAAAQGDRQAGDQLLPLVYEELRKLAAARLAREPGGGAGFTLEPTALVHEAYLKLLGPAGGVGGVEVQWNGRGHFFGAAALAMRRILIDRARSRKGARGRRADVEIDALAAEPEPDEMLAIDESLKKLEHVDKRKYEVVMLRYFAGLSIEDTAAALGISPATVKNDWTFARAWLKRDIGGRSESDGDRA